jgi:hypothetical protein
MRSAGFWLYAAYLAVAAEAFGAGSAPRAPKIAAAAGVTPGGFLFNVVPAASRLKLYGLDGGTRAAYALQPGEGFVLGVADTGARVTSSSARGVRRRGMPFEEGREPAAARLVFRDPRGNVLATREPEILRDSAVEVRGDEVYYVRRVEGEYVVFRTSAAELETAVARTSSDRVRRETGRVDSVTLHASAAGVVAEFHGPYRAVYVDVANPGRLIAPDATLACGESRYAPVWPRAGGGITRISSGSAAARLETFDLAGRIASTADLAPASRFAVLPDGSLLAMRGGEIFVLDERGRETSHVVLAPDEEGLTIALPETSGAPPLREGATGADWAEAVLKTGAPRGGEAVAARDPNGALERFARVQDSDPGAGRSREALRMFFDSHAFAYVLGRPRDAAVQPAPPATDTRAEAAARWDGILTSASARAHPDGPAWFQRETARALLAAGAEKAPAWALEVVVEAVSSGRDADSAGFLPEAAFTPALAEIVSALERERLDRLEPLPAFDEADVEASEDGGAAADFFGAMQNRELRLSATRFPALVLSCASGATPQRLEVVARALMAPAAGLWWEGAQGVADDENEPTPPEPRGAETAQARSVAQARFADAAAAVSGLLGPASRSGDADERALAQALAPMYRLPIDAAGYRRDVLTRPALETIAVPVLLMDRSLGSVEWSRLMADSLAAARAHAADPVGCLASPMRAMQDRYCQTLLEVFGSLTYGDQSPGSPQNARRAEILALARSPEAPAEVRLQGQLLRVLTGGATAAEIVEVWREKDLPRYVRQAALAGSRTGSVPDGLPDALQRELRNERLSSEDAAALLEALRTADKAAARRIALERWEKGNVPLTGGERDDHETSPWIAALDPQDAVTSPAVHAAFRQLLSDEKNGPAAAALLSKAGDAEALPRVLEAVRTGCLA